MFDGEYQPWERRKGEPVNWFARFSNYYLPLGEERTIEAAFRAWRADYLQLAGISGYKQKRPSPSWYEVIEKWGWKERAELWDKEQRRLKEVEETKEKLEWQDKRRQLMTGFFAKIAAALGKTNLDNPSLSALTYALKMVLEQNRLEYGLPTEITEQRVYDVEFRESNEN